MTTHDEWRPALDADTPVRLKWAFNGETKDVEIWEVGGPGDGFPTHHDHLVRIWRREPRPEAGDTLGSVTLAGNTLRVATYYDAPTPSALFDRLRKRFPDTAIQQ